MKHSCLGRSMTRYVILGMITFLIGGGVTSAQTVIAEQGGDSAPWLLDKTAKPLPGGKDEAKTPEPPPIDAREKDEAKAPEPRATDVGRKEAAKTPERVPPARSASTAGKEVSAESNPSSGWLPPSRSYGSCRHSAPDQEDFLCKLGRILFESPRSGPNRDVDENISAGGAGG